MKPTKKESAWVEASRRYRDLSSKVDDERRNLVSEATKKIDEIIRDKYAEKLEALRIAATEAQVEMEKDTVERAKASSTYPVGSKVWVWQRKYNYFAYSSTWCKVGTGIIEVVSHDSVFQANMKNSAPIIGTIIVRMHKKDGTIGKNFHRLEVGIKVFLREDEAPTS